MGLEIYCYKPDRGVCTRKRRKNRRTLWCALHHFLKSNGNSIVTKCFKRMKGRIFLFFNSLGQNGSRLVTEWTEMFHTPYADGQFRLGMCELGAKKVPEKSFCLATSMRQNESVFCITLWKTVKWLQLNRAHTTWRRSFLPGIKKFGNLFKGVKTLTVLSTDDVTCS